MLQCQWLVTKRLETLIGVIEHGRSYRSRNKHEFKRNWTRSWRRNWKGLLLPLSKILSKGISNLTFSSRLICNINSSQFIDRLSLDTIYLILIFDQPTISSTNPRCPNRESAKMKNSTFTTWYLFIPNDKIKEKFSSQFSFVFHWVLSRKFFVSCAKLKEEWRKKRAKINQIINLYM